MTRVNTKPCVHCGKEFVTYNHKRDMYCSHECYILGRYGDIQRRNEEIRKLRSQGKTLQHIAKLYGITHQWVSQIVRRK